jgi:hypothetical protein
LEQGDLSRCQDDAKTALTEATERTYRWGMGDAAYLLAKCAHQQTRDTEAMTYAQQALEIRRLIRDPRAQHVEALMQQIDSSHQKGTP